MSEHATASGENRSALAERIGAGGASQLKCELTDALNAVLRPIRQRRRAAAANPGDLDRILHGGNARAREVAAETLRHVHRALGMTYADQSEDSGTV